MQTTVRSRLFSRLLRLYVSVVLFGVFLITLHNLYTNRLPLREFFQFHFFIKLMLGVLFVLLFQSVTFLRLRHVGRCLSGEGGADGRKAAWRSLIAFPSEVFWGMIVYGLVVSPAYHFLVTARQRGGWPDLPAGQGWLLLENLLFDQALTLTLSVVFYTALSGICRDYLADISGEDSAIARPSNFVASLLVTYTALYLITAFSMLWYISNSITAGHEVRLPVLAGIGAACLLMASWVFSRGALDFRDRFRVLVSRIREILKQSRGLEQGRIPIVSTDEAGQLAVAINRLQRHIAKEFEGVQRELKLARQVQMRLMPSAYEANGPLKIAAACRLTKEVGGDFYDVVKIDEKRTAVVIGDVSGKGMQAALIMSAAIVLLRSEIRRGGHAAQILSRLNRDLAGTLGPTSYVTLFIAILDMERSMADYASAGHLSPYLLRAGSLKELDCSSLPLGIDPDETYAGKQIRLEAGDRMVLVTDGVIEAAAPLGEMLGFENFERLLPHLPAASHPMDALNELIARLPWETSSPHEDDRTLVLVQV